MRVRAEEKIVNLGELAGSIQTSGRETGDLGGASFLPRLANAEGGDDKRQF